MRARDAEQRRYVWRVGVLGFGLTTAALTTLWDGYKAMTQPRATAVGFVIDAVGNVVFFGLLGGYLWGRVMWALLRGRSR